MNSINDQAVERVCTAYAAAAEAEGFALPEGAQLERHQRWMRAALMDTPASASEAVGEVVDISVGKEPLRAGRWFGEKPAPDTKLYTHPAPASGEGQQGDDFMTEVAPGVKLPVWLIQAAAKISQYMAVHHSGAWELDGIQSRRGHIVATQQQAGQAVAWADPAELALLRKHGGMLVVATSECEPESRRTTALYTAPQTGDGYVLVPREPTEAMLLAGWKLVDAAGDRAGQVYRAMIAASEASHG